VLICVAVTFQFSLLEFVFASEFKKCFSFRAAIEDRFTECCKMGLLSANVKRQRHTIWDDNIVNKPDHSLLRFVFVCHTSMFWMV
jgi:hypothetical protein